MVLLSPYCLTSDAVSTGFCDILVTKPNVKMFQAEDVNCDKYCLLNLLFIVSH